jgi:signal transduction histidine kinase
MENEKQLESILITGTFLMLLLAFIFLFMFFYYQQNIAKIKKRESELMLKTALNSEKKERKRISKDLHDAIQSDLNAVRNYVILFSKKNQNTSSPELLAYIKTSLDQAIENTRLIAFQMMPPLLETSGFNLALRNYFDQLQASNDKLFIIKYSVSDVDVPDSIAYELFRVVQELISNMLKHGSITECSANLFTKGNELCFILEDDGIPFNFKEALHTNQGCGLQNIQSRLKSISGRIEQKSILNRNQFIIHIPNHD